MKYLINNPTFPLYKKTENLQKMGLYNIFNKIFTCRTQSLGKHHSHCYRCCRRCLAASWGVGGAGDLCFECSLSA